MNEWNDLLNSRNDLAASQIFSETSEISEQSKNLEKPRKQKRNVVFEMENTGENTMILIATFEGTKSNEVQKNMCELSVDLFIKEAAISNIVAIDDDISYLYNACIEKLKSMEIKHILDSVSKDEWDEFISDQWMPLIDSSEIKIVEFSKDDIVLVKIKIDSAIRAFVAAIGGVKL